MSGAPKGRKATQRERLLSAMVTVAGREGYAGASVSAVIEQAGVSRPTFYDYFADRDDCFLATLAGIQERLLDEVRGVVDAGAPQDAVRGTIGALLAFASKEPAMAHFLMGVSMAGGPRALDARDHGILEVQRVVDRAHRRVRAQAAIPDVSARVLVGGVFRLLAAGPHPRAGGLGGVEDDLLDWVDSYRQTGPGRWRTLKPAARPGRSPFVVCKPECAPRPLGPGRPEISSDEVAINHRARILFATASAGRESGFTASTIAQITRLAGVDGRVFYSLFDDKRQAFMAVQEHTLRRLMGVTARAFFSGGRWPERVWEAARAFSQYLELNPALAHVAFVEPYAIGAGAAQRMQDAQVAFTMLLQDGYEHASRQPAPSSLALEAIVASIFEIVHLQVRAGGRGGRPRLSGLSGQLAFLCLAPFLGARAAGRSIGEKA